MDGPLKVGDRMQPWRAEDIIRAAQSFCAEKGIDASSPIEVVASIVTRTGNKAPLETEEVIWSSRGIACRKRWRRGP